MVIRTYKYTGADLMAPTVTPTGYVASDGDNLLFTPMLSSPTVVEGVAEHTHFPLEGRNILWNSVKTELYRYTTTSPASYTSNLDLYGLNSGGETLIGQQVFTTCTSPATTDIVGFDLTRSACRAPLNVESTLTSAGTVRVNLPLEYGNYEEVVLGNKYYFLDQFNDSSINANWTAATPAGTISETTTLNFSVGAGVAAAWGSCPIIHTPPPSSGDWRCSVKMENYTVNNQTMTGLMLYRDANNVYHFGRRRDDGLSINEFRLNKRVGGVATDGLKTIASTTLPMYLQISYIGGTYYFHYSLTGTGWSFAYSTSSLGFTPTSIGMFGFNWGGNTAFAPVFEDFIITNKTGNSVYDSTVSMSATPGDTDLYINYTTPSLWRDGTYTTLTYNEYGSFDHTTNPVPLNAKSIARLGYDSMDKYDGLKIKITTNSDDTYTTKWNWLEYKYEV